MFDPITTPSHLITIHRISNHTKQAKLELDWPWPSNPREKRARPLDRIENMHTPWNPFRRPQFYIYKLRHTVMDWAAHQKPHEGGRNCTWACVDHVLGVYIYRLGLGRVPVHAWATTHARSRDASAYRPCKSSLLQVSWVTFSYRAEPGLLPC